MLSLPSEPQLFQAEGWMKDVRALFKGLDETRPPPLNRNTSSGQLISTRFIVLDHLDQEIFFPTVMLRNCNTGEKFERVTAFREAVDIPDGWETVEETDFRNARDRNCYLVQVPGNDTEWATDHWGKILNVKSPNGHNDDKLEFQISTQFVLKMYNNEPLKVLHVYHVRGIFYPSDDFSSAGQIHVIDASPAACYPDVELDVDHVSIFDDTLELLSQALLGDYVAAKFLLCSLISSVYLRRSEMVLGSITVNLNLKESKEYTATGIGRVLSEIVPCLTKLGLSITYLNKRPLTPTKTYDHDEERLNHSDLSIPPRTSLIIDESGIDAGGLTHVGTRNLDTLRQLIEDQTLEFDYQYYKKDFETDISCIVISNGKSLLPNDYSIMVKADIDSNLEEYYDRLIDTARASSLLGKVRSYLSKCKSISFDVGDDKMVEDFIVESRRANEKLGVRELHQLLVLARSLAIGRGFGTSKKVYLEEARDMIKKLQDIA